MWAHTLGVYLLVFYKLLFLGVKGRTKGVNPWPTSLIKFPRLEDFHQTLWNAVGEWWWYITDPNLGRKSASWGFSLRLSEQSQQRTAVIFPIPSLVNFFRLAHLHSPENNSKMKMSETWSHYSCYNIGINIMARSFSKGKVFDIVY